MTDDIVTRLRDKASQVRCVVGVNTSVVIPMLEIEAADEIERLRSELAEARNGLTWIVKIPNRPLEQDND